MPVPKSIFNKAAGLCDFIARETPAQMVSSEFCEFLRTILL